MDFFIDNYVKNCINHIITNKDTIQDNTSIWKSMTRLMFKNYPATQVWLWIEEISQEAYDKDWFEHKYPEEQFKKKFVEKISKRKKRNYKEYPLLHPEIEKIISKVSILDLADRYDLRPLGKTKRICPFHADSDPSLSLDDNKGLFHCFGCHASGNIIKFKAMLNKIGVKNGSE